MFPGEAKVKFQENMSNPDFELRPQGVYGMRLNRRKDDTYELAVDNRNARGYKPMTEGLHEAVDAALKTDNDS